MSAACSSRTSVRNSSTLPCGSRFRAVLRVRREETDRHVAPVVRLLRIELEHGEQLHGRDAQLLQVRDLVDHAQERAAFRLVDSGRGALGESANVSLVNDELAFVSRRAIVPPIERRSGPGKYRKRSHSQRRPGHHRRRAIKRLGKVHDFRVRIEKDLLRVERVPVIATVGRGALDAVTVEVQTFELGRRNSGSAKRSASCCAAGRVRRRGRRAKRLPDERTAG